MKRLADRILPDRRLPLILCFLAILLTLPSVWTGWQQDDLVHRYFLLGHPDYKGETIDPWNLFSYLNGDPVAGRALMDAGILPWWSLENIRLSFLRPLSSLTMWFDYLLWPDSAPLMHIQSLLWFGALVLVAAMLYRQYSAAPWVAGLSALLFAIDDAHGLPAGWLAGRNGILVALFGILLLTFHDRWRRNQWSPGRFLAPICLILGLLSGEGVLAVGAYLLAYALLLDPGNVRERMMSLLPYGVIALSWLILYRYLGYGTWGSGFYVDPLSEPFRFAQALFERGPILLLDQWGFPPSTIYIMLDPGAAELLWLWALLFLTALAVALYPLLRRDPTARFWALGMVLSVPVICATMPHSRLLFFVGLGGMGLLAQWISGMVQGADWVPSGRVWYVPARALLWMFIVVHLILAPLILPMNSRAATFGEQYIRDVADIESVDEAITRQDLVLVNPPIVFFAHYITTARVLAGLPLPRHVRALAPGMQKLQITRQDEHTLTIRPEGGFLSAPFDNLYRGPAHPMHPGDVIELSNMTVEITETASDGRPVEARFIFGPPLEDPALRFFEWKDGRYVPFKLPEVGEHFILPAIPLAL